MDYIVKSTILLSVIGLLLGSLIFFPLRTFPLRALRRVTDALSEQKQLAEITLRSIGDAVISTDAAALVRFMNPVAEDLSSWTLSEAKGRPIEDILHLIDATNGNLVDPSLRQALAEKRIVSGQHEIDLVKRDGSKIGIENNVAPIFTPQGSISGGVITFRDVSSARASSLQRSWEATHDALTGLVNRRELERLIKLSVASAQNEGRVHALCYMDLDQFKVINDTCGHAAGDELLKNIAELMQSNIRKADTLARLGGDEFVLLLDSCSLERARLISADLLAGVGEFRFNWGTQVFTIGVSIGLVPITSEISSDKVLGMADTACYWAKEQGRNRVCVYSDEDSEILTRHREMGWIARITLALAENRFTLYHQSYLQLDTTDGGRKHIEILLRMIDEEGNLIPPISFIPAAEHYNLMPSIDRWVIGMVFSRYHDLVAKWGGEPLTCAINLSGTSLNAEGFIDFVRQQALEYKLPQQSICFEITETAAIKNLKKVGLLVQEFKSMGFLFALDDFGTGTRSFGYLKTLPVDYLKIDGGFVKGLEHNAIDKAMTGSINNMGHIMGIKTIAEFAENDVIIQELRSMGVDYAQGYGICLPTPLFGPVLQSDSVSQNDQKT